MNEVDPKVDSGVRQRKLIFIAIGALIVGGLVVLALVIGLYTGRSDSRTYYNNQIRMLVCAVPPGDETRNLLRERAKCGPYVAPSRPAEAPATSTPRSSPSSTRTLTGEARLAPPTAPARAPGQRASGVDMTPRPLPRATAAARTPAPVTRTRETTVTASPTGTEGLIPGLVCTLLGCRTETP